MIKNIVFISFFLFSIHGFSQFNRSLNRNQPNVNAKAQKPLEFNVEKAIGLTIYDTEKAFKKIGIKASSDNFSKIDSIFKRFNKEQKDFSRINSFAFSQAKVLVEAAQKKTQDSQDYSFVQKAYLKIIEDLKPTIDLVQKKEEQLDASLKPLLSEKQFSKWIKYKAKSKKR